MLLFTQIRRKTTPTTTKRKKGKARQGKSMKGKERARKGKGAGYHSSSAVMNLRLEKKNYTYFFMP